MAEDLDIEGEEAAAGLRRRLRAMERDGQLASLVVSAMRCRNASTW
ncbi:hypothetical protein ACNKHX_26610 [Shigella flexneri]